MPNLEAEDRASTFVPRTFRERYLIQFIGLGQPVGWTLDGHSRNRYVAFSANADGEKLQLTCSRPLPPAPFVDISG
jgi:hypothetical protein